MWQKSCWRINLQIQNSDPPCPTPKSRVHNFSPLRLERIKVRGDPVLPACSVEREILRAPEAHGVIFSIWKIHETIIGNKYAEALCVFWLTRGDLGFCPKLEWLCTFFSMQLYRNKSTFGRIGGWNSVFPCDGVFPRNQADRVKTCPYRNTRECPFRLY